MRAEHFLEAGEAGLDLGVLPAAGRLAAKARSSRFRPPEAKTGADGRSLLARHPDSGYRGYPRSLLCLRHPDSGAIGATRLTRTSRLPPHSPHRRDSPSSCQTSSVRNGIIGCNSRKSVSSAWVNTRWADRPRPFVLEPRS